MKNLIAYYWQNYGFPWLVAALVLSMWMIPAHAQMTQNQFSDFIAGRPVVSESQAQDCLRLGNVMASVVGSRDSGMKESEWKKATITIQVYGRDVKMSMWQYAGVRKDTFLFLVHDAYARPVLRQDEARPFYNMQCRTAVENANHRPVDISEDQ